MTSRVLPASPSTCLANTSVQHTTVRMWRWRNRRACGFSRETKASTYLGMLVVLLAWAVLLSSPASIAGVVAFWFYIDRFQIRPEEKVLAALFSHAFTDY